MRIDELRKEIDKIDDELSALYVKRLGYCKEIGEEKKKENAPVNVPNRENAILARITKEAPEELKIYVKQLYDNIFLQSKNYQNRTVGFIENGSWENVYSGKYRSQMHHNALIANLTAWMARYNAHIVFCKAETFPKLAKEILYREAKEYLQDMEVNAE